jgi:hypothetical protein
MGGNSQGRSGLIGAAPQSVAEQRSL